MHSGIQARRLRPADAEAIARVFNSRDKLMLRTKNDRQRALASEIPEALTRGYEAYGTFYDDDLQAFCLFYPWQDLPYSTCSLMQSRPVPGPVDLLKNGLAFCLDAALASLESRGYTHLVYRRALDVKWRKNLLLRNAGRAAQYTYTLVERIAAGDASKWGRINQHVLNNRPVEHDTAIVIAARPEAG